MKIIKEKTCTITGHRPKGLPWGYNENDNRCVKFKEDLKVILTGAIKYGLDTFLVGMAEGFDMICTEILIELRKVFNHIKIIACTPCLNQEKLWSIEQQERYKQLLKKCDKQILISEKYTRTCMMDRNKFMVDNSNVVIACFNCSNGGTRNTLIYAKEKHLKIRIINIS